MKRILPILFLLAFVTTSLKQYYPYLDYSINKNYISEFLCVNKDKPELRCEGKCHLNKQLKKINTEDNGNFPIPSPNEEVSSILFFQSDRPISFVIITESDLKKSNYNASFVSSFQLEIPTPPPQFL
jgi:hypothetical protein